MSRKGTVILPEKPPERRPQPASPPPRPPMKPPQAPPGPKNDLALEWWSVGRVLPTANTQSWSPETLQIAEGKERRCVYARFTTMDDGRSRILVAACERPEDAENVVRFHNSLLARLERIEQAVRDNAEDMLRLVRE